MHRYSHLLQFLVPLTMRKMLLILILLLVVFVDYSYGQGCSQCKLVAEQGSELDEGGFGSNINFGILYLMAIPYVLLFLLFRKKIIALVKQLIKTP